MAPLFFAVAATSSDARGPAAGGHLALVPGTGGGGWQSARCCDYPQELLLQLERGALIHEVEIAARGELAPSAVEVHFSSFASDDPALGPGFVPAGTLHFDAEDPGRRVPTARRARLKTFAQCAGQVRLLVHGPSGQGPGNPFGQVALASVELWGREDPVPSATSSRAPAGAARAPPASLGGDAGEIARVLTELGIPLDVVPLDEEEIKFANADPDTRRLLVELQRRKLKLHEASSFGEAQRLTEHIARLAELGAELNRLARERDRLAGAGRVGDAGQLEPEIRRLEARRLDAAALLDTDWWLEAMALPSGGAGFATDAGDGQLEEEPPPP